MPKSPSEILSDPQFQALPLGEQLKVMRTTDPNFAGLPTKQQGLVIAKARQKSLGIDNIEKLTAEPPKTGFRGVVEGFQKGAASTVSGAMALLPGSVGRTGKELHDSPELAARGTAESIGKGVEQFGEYFIPGIGEEEIAGKGALAIGKTALRAGLKQGGVAAAQGGDLKSGIIPGMLGGTISGLAKGISVGADALPKGPKNLNNPVEEKALDWAEKKGIPESVGQRTGQRGLQRVEQGLTNLPGSASRAGQFYKGQQGAIAKVGEKLAENRTGLGNAPVRTDAAGAGEVVQERLGSRIDDLKKFANKLYDSTRQTAARNVKEVQTGTKDIPASTILDASGRPMAEASTVPVMSKMESPVDLTPIRSKLQPVYEELNRTLSPGQREFNPAYNDLRTLMESPDKQMGAMDFDKFLGAVKSLARNGQHGALSDQSRRLALQVVTAGEKSFQDALSDAGPNVVDKLMKARKAVAEYHKTGDLLADLHDEPAAVYKGLVRGGDLSINTLNHLNQIAPNAMKTVGRTFLEGLVDTATKEGGFSRSDGVARAWTGMGPRTKQLLFGSQLTGELDQFFLAAKRLTSNANPSGTAHMLQAMGGVGAGAATAYYMFTGDAKKAAELGVGAFLLPAVASKVLFTPGGPTIMRNLIISKVGSPAFARNAKLLSEAASAAASELQQSSGTSGSW